MDAGEKRKRERDGGDEANVNVCVTRESECLYEVNDIFNQSSQRRIFLSDTHTLRLRKLKSLSSNQLVFNDRKQTHITRNERNKKWRRCIFIKYEFAFEESSY